MVKFGKYLESHQIPEWSSQYVRYKRLKKVLKQCKAQKDAQQAAERAAESTTLGSQKGASAAQPPSRRHSSAAESEESGDDSGGDVEEGGRGSISAARGASSQTTGAAAAAFSQRASLARQTAEVEKALSSGAEWIAKSRAEVGERERQTKAQNAAEASGMQARRLSQVHLQPPSGDAHNPSNVDMTALATTPTAPAAASGASSSDTLQVRITPPPSLGDVGRRGSSLPMPTPLVPVASGPGSARYSQIEEEEGDAAHEEHDDQKALSDALSEGKRHLTDALLFAEDMHIRKLSSYIPSRVRATFLPAEHDFFQLLEEDVETCNHFFLKQEEFFLDKINVIVEQLDRLIKEEEDEEARNRAAKARAAELEAQQRKQSMMQRALMQVQQRLPMGGSSSSATATKQVATGEGPAAPTQSPSPPAVPGASISPPLADSLLQHPPPSSVSPPPAAAPNALQPPPPPPPNPPSVPAPTAASAEAAANYLAVSGSIESGVRPSPRHDAAANSGAFPPTMSVPAASALPSSAAAAASIPVLSTAPSSDSLLAAAHYPGADLELVRSHSDADIGTDSGDEPEHDQERQAQAAASRQGAMQHLDHFGDEALHQEAQQHEDAEHAGHFVYAAPGAASTAVAALSPPPPAAAPDSAPSLAQRMHLNLQFRLLTAQKPWKVLEKALTELYRGLQLLRNYKILQFTAFVKILKKYDKLNLHPSTLPPPTPSDSEDEEPSTNRRNRAKPRGGIGGGGGGSGTATPIPDDLGFKASALLLPRIQSTHFLASPILKAFIRRVELIFAHTFTKGNHKAALEGLRIVQPPLSQGVIFRLGLLLGVSGVLAIVLIVLASWVSFEVVGSSLGSNVSANLPIWRSLALIILHLWGWGGAVWVFHKYRINHEFIFEINPRTELKFEQVLLLAATLSSIWFAMINLYLLLDLARDSGPGWSGIQPGYVVLTAFLGMVILALYPGDFLFRPTRWYILRTLGKIVTAPLWAVDFKDFYVADQLTSLVNVLNDICYSICHLTTGAFLDNRMADTQCTDVQNTAVWCLAFLPYFWRLLQCLRKYRDNPPANQRQLVNACKYAASMFTTLFALLYRNVSPNFLAPWICVATLTTLFTYSWDVVCDWGFFHFDQGRLCPSVLRRKLLLKNPGPYYFAIVSNLLLRVSWVFTISPSRFGINLNKDIFNSIVWALEILRRNQWNVYRLENEHLTNCENYRVVNIVPLKMEGAVLLGNTAEQAEKIAAAEEGKIRRSTGGGGAEAEAETGGAGDPDALVVESSRDRAARIKEHARKRSREIELQSRAGTDESMQPSSPTLGEESLPLDPARRRDHPTVCSMLTAPDARVLDPDRHDNPDMHEATFRSGSGSRKGSFADVLDAAGAVHEDWTVHVDDEGAAARDTLKVKLSPSESDLAEQHDAVLEQAAAAAQPQQQQQWPQDSFVARPSEVSPESIVNRPYGGSGGVDVVDSTLSPPVQPYVNPNVQHALKLQEQEQAVIKARRQSISGASAGLGSAAQQRASRLSMMAHPPHHPGQMIHAASSLQLGSSGGLHSRFPAAVSPRHFQATALAPTSAGPLLQRQFSDPMMTDNIARRAAATARRSARREATAAEQQLYGTGLSPLSAATPNSAPHLSNTPPVSVPAGAEAAATTPGELRPPMPARNATASVLHRSRRLPRADDVSTGDDWLMHTRAFDRDAANESTLPNFDRDDTGNQSDVVARAQRAAVIAAGQAGAADGVLSPTGRHAHLRDADAREEARRDEENAADDLFDRVLARRRAMHQLSAPALAHNAMASLVATTTGAAGGSSSSIPNLARGRSSSISSFPMGYASGVNNGSSGSNLQSMPQQSRRLPPGVARRPSQQLSSSPNLYASCYGEPGSFQRRPTASSFAPRNGSASPLNRPPPSAPTPRMMAVKTTPTPPLSMQMQSSTSAQQQSDLPPPAASAPVPATIPAPAAAAPVAAVPAVPAQPLAAAVPASAPPVAASSVSSAPNANPSPAAPPSAALAAASTVAASAPHATESASASDAPSVLTPPGAP